MKKILAYILLLILALGGVASAAITPQNVAKDDAGFIRPISLTDYIKAPYFVGTSTATSTLGGGINIAGGCFAVSGVCVGSGSSAGGSNFQLQYNLNGTLFGTSTPTVTGIIATSTTATSSFPIMNTKNLHAYDSSGFLLESNNGTDIGLFGASGGSNVTWYGNSNFNTATANTLASFGASKTLQSASTNSTLSFTSNTLGINLGNSNTWSVMQGFDDGAGNAAYLANTAGGIGGSFTGTGIGGTFSTYDNAYYAGLASGADFAAGYFSDNFNFTAVTLANASYAVDAIGVINTSGGYTMNGAGIPVSYWNDDSYYNLAIQFYDEGGAVGSPGGVAGINFIGSGVTATYTGGILEVDIPGGSGSGTVNSGTQGQVAFYSTTGTAVSGTSTMTILGGKVGISTTSPFAKLSVAGGNAWIDGTVTASYFIGTSTATSTFAQGINIATGCFAVNGVCVGGSGTVNSGTQGQVAFYNANGTVVSGTPTIFVDSNSNIGIGSSTPWASLSVASSTYNMGTSIQPIFAVSTSSDLFGSIGTAYGTTTARNASSTFSLGIVENGARWIFGMFKGKTLDTVKIQGTLSSSWKNEACDSPYIITNITADGTGVLCNSSYDEGTAGTISNYTDADGTRGVSMQITNAATADYSRISIGNNFYSNFIASTTPIIDFSGYVGTSTIGTTTNFMIGFPDTITTAAAANGCWIGATSTQNWRGVCMKGGTATVLDLRVSTSTLSRMRMELRTDGQAHFFSKNTATGEMIYRGAIAIPTAITAPGSIRVMRSTGGTAAAPTLIIKNWRYHQLEPWYVID